MPVTIDEKSVAARVALRRRRERIGVVDLRVHLDGLDRHASWQATEDAIAAVPHLSQDSTAYPTVGGTVALLSLASRPVASMAMLQEVADHLSARGLHGSIDAADPPAPRPPAGRSSPVALMGFTVDPPVSAGPFNDAGVPEPRWSAAQAGHDALLTHLTALADTAPAARLGSADVLLVPTHPEHTRDVVEQELEHWSECDFATYSEAPDAKSGPEIVRHAVSLWHLGTVTWGNADPSLGDQQASYARESLLRRFAAHLDVGFVGYCAPTPSARLYLDSVPWGDRRHLWTSYVPAPHGVQLLTNAHLDRAHDLSGWLLDEVVPGRWLVTHPDREAWLTPEPDPELVAQATADFGAMVLTFETALANPIHPA